LFKRQFSLNSFDENCPTCLAAECLEQTGRCRTVSRFHSSWWNQPANTCRCTYMYNTSH